MALATIECPECQKVLKLPAELAPGKKIRCPKCQTVFAVPDGHKRPETAISTKKGPVAAARKREVDEDDEEIEEPVRRKRPAAGPPPRRRRRDIDEDEDEDEEEEERPRRKKKRAQKDNTMLILLSSGAAVLVLAVFALTAFVWPGFLRSSDKSGIKAGPGPAGAPVVGQPPLAKGPAAGGKFQEFNSLPGRFKVLFPRNPQEKVQNTPGGILKMYLVEERDGAYMASFVDLPLPQGETEAQTQIRLTGARDGALRNVNATLIRETNIRLAGKYPGREIEGNLPQNKGIFRARFYIVGTRMYQVMVVGSRAWAGLADAPRFLDSFALTN